MQVYFVERSFSELKDSNNKFTSGISQSVASECPDAHLFVLLELLLDRGLVLAQAPCLSLGPSTHRCS